MDVLVPHTFMLCRMKYIHLLEGNLVICVHVQLGCSLELKVERFGKMR